MKTAAKNGDQNGNAANSAAQLEWGKFLQLCGGTGALNDIGDLFVRASDFLAIGDYESVLIVCKGALKVHSNMLANESTPKNPAQARAKAENDKQQSSKVLQTLIEFMTRLHKNDRIDDALSIYEEALNLGVAKITFSIDEVSACAARAADFLDVARASCIGEVREMCNQNPSHRLNDQMTNKLARILDLAIELYIRDSKGTSQPFNQESDTALMIKYFLNETLPTARAEQNDQAASSSAQHGNKKAVLLKLAYRTYVTDKYAYSLVASRMAKEIDLPTSEFWTQNDKLCNKSYDTSTLGEWNGYRCEWYHSAADAYYYEAMALCGLREQYIEAIELCKKALELEPSHFPAAICASQAHACLYQHAEADALLQYVIHGCKEDIEIEKHNPNPSRLNATERLLNKSCEQQIALQKIFGTTESCDSTDDESVDMQDLLAAGFVDETNGQHNHTLHIIHIPD